jgi:hypothetical protein
MTPSTGFRLRHLAFHGPGRDRALVEFGPGLNLVYGASEAGKSFILDSLDFMLGGKPPLRDLPERQGYDRILFGIETIGGDKFTLWRHVDGGGFRAYPGLHIDPPAADYKFEELSEMHSGTSQANLSSFLLDHCGLGGKRVRRNKYGGTNSLSFRNIARLLIVTETDITETRSPLSDGNKVADTPNFATFKLLLTGADDTALVSTKSDTVEEQSRDAQLGLLDQLVDEHRDRLREITKAPAAELEEQLQKLEATLAQFDSQLKASEADYRSRIERRRELRKKVEEGKERRAEVGALFERFTLLDRHYVSDMARLQGIEEGGTLFEVLGKAACPLCGADPANHDLNTACDGNVTAVVLAARSEIAKIELLRKELTETILNLRREASRFDKSLPKAEEELNGISTEVEEMISPQLTKLRSSYSQLANKRGQVREALSLYRSIQDIEARREKIEQTPDDQKDGASIAGGDLQSTVADQFAQHVEGILKQWHFPNAERVFFDPKARDLVIGGKLRTARGKGLRAITHAAFTIGLLDYCRTNNQNHPGFVVLDSPLLTYRAPEGTEDDLSGTDLNAQFYNYLAALVPDRQVIIIENTDPPESVTQLPQVIMFSGNPHSGRYGFFPLPTKPKLLKAAPEAVVPEAAPEDSGP